MARPTDKELSAMLKKATRYAKYWPMDDETQQAKKDAEKFSAAADALDAEPPSCKQCGLPMSLQDTPQLEVGEPEQQWVCDGPNDSTKEKGCWNTEYAASAPSEKRPGNATDVEPVHCYGVRKCRGHWHVTIGGEDVVADGDPFPTAEAALVQADVLNGVFEVATPSEKREAAPQPGTSEYFARNIATLELANTVARFLGLKPEDEIPFAELTRQLEARIIAAASSPEETPRS